MQLGAPEQQKEAGGAHRPTSEFSCRFRSGRFAPSAASHLIRKPVGGSPAETYDPLFAALLHALDCDAALVVRDPWAI